MDIVGTELLEFTKNTNILLDNVGTNVKISFHFEELAKFLNTSTL